MVIQNDIIYVSDNLGYLYALDFNSNIILWAKNYKIPFRSNIKIIENKIVTANQNNILFFLISKTVKLFSQYQRKKIFLIMNL